MGDRYHTNANRARRHEGKRQRLGTPNPVCVICGCTNLLAMTPTPFSRLPKSVQRRVLEEHHPAGRLGQAALVVVCLNCHAALSDAQYDWDERLRRPSTRHERLAAYLRGLSDMFRQEGATRHVQADELKAMADELLSEDAQTD